MRRLGLQLFLTVIGLGWVFPAAVGAGDGKILNVSYDVTREFYQELNPIFVAQWKAQTGETITINQSHGGSSKQVRSVIDGLEADVVTMNNFLDINMLQEFGHLIPKDWASRLPQRSTPYTSTILFLVRKGNPKGIQDWQDLVKPEVKVILPNPKTSGNGRYSYLAAYGFALRRSGGNTNEARQFIQRLLANVPVLDAGGRGATTSFAQRGLGDVLLTFENEIHLIQREFGEDSFQVIIPSSSILAENPVVWVDKVVTRRGSAQLAKAYLEFLFSERGQELAAKHHFRPINEAVRARYRDRFKPLQLFSVEEVAGGWSEAQRRHFADGGWFDQIYQSPNR